VISAREHVDAVVANGKVFFFAFLHATLTNSWGFKSPGHFFSFYFSRKYRS
jgi:hypothetical protein